MYNSTTLNKREYYIMNQSPVYNAQVKTFSIAKKLANDYRSVTGMDACMKPPFCLRIVAEHRTPSMQEFRNQVAKEARALRGKI